MCFSLFCSPLHCWYMPSTVIPGVLFKIQTKSWQSASRVLPHDRAFCCLLHINNQLFVEVQAATVGMTYCWVYRDERLLEVCFSKKWRQQCIFSLVSFVQWNSLFWVVSWVLGLNALQSITLIPSLDVFTEIYRALTFSLKCWWKGKSLTRK